MSACAVQFSRAGQSLGVVCDRAGAPAPVVLEREQADLDSTDRSTAQTVRRMALHVHNAAPDPAVRGAVAEALRARPAADPRTAAWLWFWWVKSHVRLVQDDELIRKLLNERDQLELLISPSVLLRMTRPQGDCDDFTMLVCAGLGALHIPAEIVTVAAELDDPERWSHVYPRAVFGPGDYMTLDSSHGDYPGWEVPRARQFRRQVWNLSGDPIRDRAPRFDGFHGYERVANPVQAGAMRRIQPIDVPASHPDASRRIQPAGVPGRNLTPGVPRRVRRRIGYRLPDGRLVALGQIEDLPGGWVTELPGEEGYTGDWTTIFQRLALTGGEIAKQVLAPLKPGEYIQTSEGIRARAVPGAVPYPPGTGVSFGTSGIGLGTVLLLGVGIVAVIAVAGRRH